LMFCFLATIWAWLHLKAAPSHKAWYAVYLGMFLAAVFSHYNAAVFLLPFTLLSLAAEKPLRRRMLVAQVVVVSCLALALGTKYLLGELPSGQEFLRPFTPFEWWMLFFNWFLHGNTLWTVNPYAMAVMGVKYLWQEPFLLLCQVCFLALFLRGLGLAQGRKRWMQAWELGLLLATPPAVMLVLTQAGYRNLYIERYFVLLLPVFLIVVARGVTSFANARTVLACAVVALLLAAASYGALLYKDDVWTVYKPNPDWRSASRYLSAESGADRAVIFVVSPSADLAYYLYRAAPGAPPKLMYYDAEKVQRLLVDGMRAFHLVKNTYWAEAFDAVLQSVKHDQRFLLASTRSFKGVEVHTFHLR